MAGQIRPTRNLPRNRETSTSTRIDDMAEQALPASKPRKNPHTDLVNTTLIMLHKLLDGRYWKNNTGGLRTPTTFIKYGLLGSTDILGICNGRMVCIEIKTGTGRLSEDQKMFKSMILDNGGIHATIRSVEDVCQFCEKVKTTDFSLPIEFGE